MKPKIPELRFPSYAMVDKVFLRGFYEDVKTWGSLTPFAQLIKGYYGVGSYACETALLYSDPDISVAFASPEDFMSARLMLVNKVDEGKWRAAREFWIQGIIRKYGVHTELALQDWDVTKCTNKSYFDFETMTLVKRDIKVKNRKRPPFMELTVTDDDSPNGLRPFDPSRDSLSDIDPWHHKTKTMRGRHGFLEIGKSADTNWIHRGRL